MAEDPEVEESNETPLIYVAGPYGDRGGYLAIEKNIANARTAAAWVVDHDMFFLCPHMNSAHFEVITPEVTIAHWYQQDLRLMRPCDAMILVGAWDASKGVTKERKKAKEWGMPVFDFNLEEERERLLEWRDNWVAAKQPEALAAGSAGNVILTDRKALADREL